jgi:hypothetical protein
MKFRFVFWDVLPCKIIVDYFTRQYIPEDKSELKDSSSFFSGDVFNNVTN